MKQVGILMAFIAISTAANAQLIINELSQGPNNNKEYVELLVTGTPVCGGANTVDLRGWIIDDNNSWHASGSGTGIAGGHVRFDSIAQWANVKIGSLILVFNDADMNTNVAALTIDTTDSNHDCVYIIPVSSSVLQKNITLPVSGGSMTTYAGGGTPYLPTGDWTCLGMANSADAFHTVSPANYALPHHAIGWGNNNALVDVYYSGSQSGKVIYMTNAVDNNPFNAANFVDTAATFETPGAPNNVANAAWIALMNNGCEPYVMPQVSFNSPAALTCTDTTTVLIASSTTLGATFNWSNGISTGNDTVSTAGTYYVTVNDGANICSAVDSITIAAVTGLSVSSSSTNTTCGNSNGTATVTVTLGSANSFHWNNGDTTAVISNLGSGNYSVTVTGGSCTATASVTVNSSSMSQVTVSSDTSIFCAGDSTQVCAPSGFVSYLWNTGETTACFYATQAGNYYVTVTDNANCTATSNHLTVSVFQLPQVSVSVNGDTLSAFNSVTYQWFFNGSVISGANSDSYIATQTGNYTVQVSDTNGCKVISNPVTVTLTGLSEVANDESISIYPNPVSSGGFSIVTSNKLLGESFKIFDNNGRLVYQSVISNAKTEIELKLAKGVYLVNITKGQNTVTQKFVRN